MEKLITALNAVAKDQGYPDWNTILRDFDLSPLRVNQMIFTAFNSLTQQP